MTFIDRVQKTSIYIHLPLTSIYLGFFNAEEVLAYCTDICINVLDVVTGLVRLVVIGQELLVGDNL